MRRRKLLLLVPFLASVILANLFLSSWFSIPIAFTPSNRCQWRRIDTQCGTGKQVTMDFDAIVFNQSATGPFSPVIQVVNDSGQMTFNMPAYVARVPGDEAVVCLAAVLSASLVGINRRIKAASIGGRCATRGGGSPGNLCQQRICHHQVSHSGTRYCPPFSSIQIAAWLILQVTYFDDHIVQVAERW